MLLPLILSLLFSLSLARPPFSVCTYNSTIPHAFVRLPFEAPRLTRLPLFFYHRCEPLLKTPIPSRRRALVVILGGALSRASDYSALASLLVLRGFVVAITQHTKRPILDLGPRFNITRLADAKRTVQESIELGFDCPPNGQFGSAKSAASLLSFLAGKKLPSKLRNLYDIRRTVLFGHSAAGVILSLMLSGACAPFEEPGAFSNDIDGLTISNRLVCEQFKDEDLPKNLQIRSIVSYAGVAPGIPIIIPKTSNYVLMHSMFLDPLVELVFSGADFGGKLGIVRVFGANHYGPANFVEENENQRPVCMRKRPPPEGQFVTSRQKQRHVLRSIAATIGAAYADIGKISRLVDNENLVVDKVTVL